ncbi:hypothetical protein K461DRAFT_306269, partial [Myriangium duriaei CBS 260.36]
MALQHLWSGFFFSFFRATSKQPIIHLNLCPYTDKDNLYINIVVSNQSHRFYIIMAYPNFALHHGMQNQTLGEKLQDQVRQLRELDVQHQAAANFAYQSHIVTSSIPGSQSDNKSSSGSNTEQSKPSRIWRSASRTRHDGQRKACSTRTVLSPSTTKANGSLFQGDSHAPVLCNTAQHAFELSPKHYHRFQVDSLWISKNLSACAGQLITPFDHRFVLDPMKLGSLHPFFAWQDLKPPLKSMEKCLRVLDIGSHDAGLTQVCTQLVQVFVSDDCGSLYVRHQTSAGTANYIDTCCTVATLGQLKRSTEIFTRLPFASGSYDTISVRALHKLDVCTRGSSGQVYQATSTMSQEVESTLQECYRLLASKGHLEYVFFERKLHAAGPLMAKLDLSDQRIYGRSQDYVAGMRTDKEVSLPLVRGNSRVASPQKDSANFLSLSQFLGILADVGFTGGKRTVLSISPFTLTKLFDESGCRRGPSDDSASQEGPENDCMLQAMFRECARLGTGWSPGADHAYKTVEKRRWRRCSPISAHGLLVIYGRSHLIEDSGMVAFKRLFA